MAYQIQINHNWQDGGAALVGAQVLSAANLYGLDEPIAITNSGVKHDFGIPVPANVVAVMILVTGNTLGVTTYAFTTWAELSGAQATQLDAITLVDGWPLAWGLGVGANPLQIVTAVRSTKIINAVGNANAARLRVRVATS